MSGYTFLENSGISETAVASGHKDQKLFGSLDSLFTGIGTIVNSALGLVGIVFFILLMYGGYLWMTAQGDESRVEKSKNIIKAAIIGLVVTMSAFAISTFVMLKFGGSVVGGN